MGSRPRDPAKERFWRDAVRRRVREGLSVREFCVQQGLNESTYHFWRRELKRRDQDFTADSGGRTRMVRGRARANGAGGVEWPFLPVALDESAVAARLDRATAAPGIEILFPQGLSLRVVAGCEPEWLRAALGALDPEWLRAVASRRELDGNEAAAPRGRARC